MDPTFIRNLFGRGLGESVDIVALHGFPLDWNRWHLSEWSKRVEAIREVSDGKPVWATEVGASSIVSPTLQAWAVDAILEQLAPVAERVYWYALMDLPECWEAMTRHKGGEGSAYYRHFRMGVCTATGQPKPAAARLFSWATTGIGVCEWVYWREQVRLERMVQLLNSLAIRRVRTGIGWADWDRPGALAWFDHVMESLAPFDVTLTLCFTPARAGLVAHHTSPPANLAGFADFCEAVVRRYGTVRAGD
jgi:beta-xylosidase